MFTLPEIRLLSTPKAVLATVEHPSTYHRGRSAQCTRFGSMGTLGTELLEWHPEPAQLKPAGSEKKMLPHFCSGLTAKSVLIWFPSESTPHPTEESTNQYLASRCPWQLKAAASLLLQSRHRQDSYSPYPCHPPCGEGLWSSFIKWTKQMTVLRKYCHLSGTSDVWQES